MARRDTDEDWVSRFADEVITTAAHRSPGKPVVVASGISPSGPIHLGNLREIMTPHLVADEVRRRGVECVHILSWDDYDRFRRVPAGIDPRWSEHIGKPLTSVPAPEGSCHPNWAEHFKAPLLEATDRLGIEMSQISQTERYTSGAYTQEVLLAMRERMAIDAVLDRHRTRPKASTAAGARPGQLSRKRRTAKDHRLRHRAAPRAEPGRRIHLFSAMRAIHRSLREVPILPHPQTSVRSRPPAGSSFTSSMPPRRACDG